MAKDEVDMASEQEDYARAEALWQVQHHSQPHASGRCHNCDEGLAPGELFCDVGCRQDFEHAAEVKRRQTGGHH